MVERPCAAPSPCSGPGGRVRCAGSQPRPEVRAYLTRSLAFVLALVAGLAVLAGPAAGPAAAKDFSITDIVIDATVLPNGDVRVHEERTVLRRHLPLRLLGLPDQGLRRRRGHRRRRAVRALHRGPDSLVGSSMIVPDTYAVQTTPTSVRVQLDFELTDIDARFYVDYTALGAAKRWQDIAELYWQFIGDQTGKPADNAIITVHLPGRDQGRREGVDPRSSVGQRHHPAGRLRCERGLAAAGVHVRRAAHPVPGRRPEQGGATGAPRLQAALAEEKALADEANRSRTWSRVKVGLWSILGFGVPLVALVLVVFLWVKYGREPKPQFKAEYLRDIPQPSLPPAMVGFIWRMGSVDAGGRHRDAARPGQPRRHRDRARADGGGRLLRDRTRSATASRGSGTRSTAWRTGRRTSSTWCSTRWPARTAS